MRRPLKSPFAIAVLALAFAATAAPASAGTIYTTSYFGEQVVGLSIGADGVLSPLPGSPFSVGGGAPSGLAFTPDGLTLIISFPFQEAVGSRTIAADGSVPVIGPEAKGHVAESPAIAPNGHFMYVGDFTGGIRTFEIGPGGLLTQIGKPVGTGGVASVALTPDGRYLFGANASKSQIDRFAIQADGTPAALPGESAEISGGSARGIRITPDGHFAVAINETGGNGRVRAYAIGDDGSLTEASPFVETPGASVVGPVLSPNGKFAYVTNYNEKVIAAYQIAADGKMKEIGTAVDAGLEEPEAMAMSDDGRFLYVQPESGGKIQAFAVAADGSLAKVGGNVTTDGGSDHTAPIPRPAVPLAKLSAIEAPPGKTTSFDATGSNDVGATITGYSWNFGDGSTETTSGPQAKHAYKKAGVYAATVTVNDDAGCVGFVFTGQSAYCNAREATATAKVDTLPVISALKANAKHGRIFFTYKLEETARVTFTIQRKVNKKKRTGAGRFGAKGKPGKNKAKLPKKLGGKALKPGRYLATAIATDPAGGHSVPVTAAFKIKPKR